MLYSSLLLATVSQMSLTFLKKVIEGKEKVDVYANTYKMIRQKDITTIGVPRYEEFAVAKK